MTSVPETPARLAAEAADAARRTLDIPAADIALVLGSGWSGGADAIGEELGRLALADLPGFTTPVVEGHGGELIAYRTATGSTAVVFTGRTHYYEDRDVDRVVHGVRTAAALGVATLVLTNGCGSINPAWGPGTPVLIGDHINLTGATPLRGPQFVNMGDAYSPRLRKAVADIRPGIGEGVYVQFAGPQYETPAEVAYARTIGGDLVGMSTTLETIAARAAGLEVLGLSLVTNIAAGISDDVLDHAEVLAAGTAAVPELRALLAEVVGLL